MGVQLNIKDPETVRLARELAGQRGETVTATIRAALEREVQLREEEIDQTVARYRAIVAEARGHWHPELDGVELSTAHGTLLYDDDGLPQ